MTPRRSGGQGKGYPGEHRRHGSLPRKGSGGARGTRKGTLTGRRPYRKLQSQQTKYSAGTAAPGTGGARITEVCVPQLPAFLEPIQYFLNTFVGLLYAKLPGKCGWKLVSGRVARSNGDVRLILPRACIACDNAIDIEKLVSVDHATGVVEELGGRYDSTSKVGCANLVKLVYVGGGFNVYWGNCNQSQLWHSGKYVYTLAQKCLVYTYIRDPLAIVTGEGYDPSKGGISILSLRRCGLLVPCIIEGFSWKLSIRFGKEKRGRDKEKRRDEAMILLADLGDYGEGLRNLVNNLYRVSGKILQCSSRMARSDVDYNFEEEWRVIKSLSNEKVSKEVPAAILFNYLLRLWLTSIALESSIDVVTRWPSIAVLRITGDRTLSVRVHTPSDVLSDLGALSGVADELGLETRRLVELLRNLVACAISAIVRVRGGESVAKPGAVLASRLVSLLDLILSGWLDYDQFYSAVRIVSSMLSSAQYGHLGECEKVLELLKR